MVLEFTGLKPLIAGYKINLKDVNKEKIKLSELYLFGIPGLPIVQAAGKNIPINLEYLKNIKMEFTVIEISADDVEDVWKRAVDKDEPPRIRTN